MMKSLILLLVLSLAAMAAPPRKKRILILCTGNSARSQMAQGILQHLDPRLDVLSAGTAPAERVNAHAIQVMREIGIDIPGGHPKSVTQFLDQSFDYVITVCDDADKNCPWFTGQVDHRIHIGFLDPAKATGSEAEILAVFRQVRDQIRTRFTAYYHSQIQRS